MYPVLLDLYWFIDTNEIVEYNGARELDDLVKFIEDLSDDKEEVDDDSSEEDGKIPEETDDSSKKDEL